MYCNHYCCVRGAMLKSKKINKYSVLFYLNYLPVNKILKYLMRNSYQVWQIGTDGQKGNVNPPFLYQTQGGTFYWRVNYLYHISGICAQYVRYYWQRTRLSLSNCNLFPSTVLEISTYQKVWCLHTDEHNSSPFSLNSSAKICQYIISLPHCFINELNQNSMQNIYRNVCGKPYYYFYEAI
jgi:hypothetical protein